MAQSNARIAGTLLFIGGVQFAIALIIAEAVYPGYSVIANFISDLGVWGKPSAVVFNPSIIFFGAAIIVASIFVKRLFSLGKIAYLYALSGVGTLCVGVFPENTFVVNGIPIFHTVSAVLAFVMGGAAAIAAYKYTKGPFRYLSVALGVAALVAFALFVSTSNFGALGLGVGGLERLIAYPTLLWTIGFGGYLLALQSDYIKRP